MPSFSQGSVHSPAKSPAFGQIIPSSQSESWPQRPMKPALVPLPPQPNARIPTIVLQIANRFMNLSIDAPAECRVGALRVLTPGHEAPHHAPSDDARPG